MPYYGHIDPCYTRGANSDNQTRSRPSSLYYVRLSDWSMLHQTTDQWKVQTAPHNTMEGLCPGTRKGVPHLTLWWDTVSRDWVCATVQHLTLWWDTMSLDWVRVCHT